MEPIPETAQALHDLGRGVGDDLRRDFETRVARVKAIVPTCVGLSLASAEHGVTFTFVASDLRVAVLDAVQYLDDDGPCIAAADEGRRLAYRVGSPLDEDRWQQFARAAGASEVASTLTFPVLVDGVVRGSVNMYASTVDAFDGHHDELAEVFDAWAAGAIANADLSFSTRETAQQAPTVLRERRDVDRAGHWLAEDRGLELGAAREHVRQAASRAGISEAVFARYLLELAGLDDD